MSVIGRIFFLGCFVFLLSGCVSLRAPESSSRFQTESPVMRQAELKKIQDWKISGAFSIQQTNRQPVIANYTWHQARNDYQIDINSILNVYTVMIVKQNKMISLYKNGALISRATTPEKLMQNTLGWSLPIGKLSDWLKDLPSPGNYYAQYYDIYGHMVELKQLGWKIKYSQYKNIRGIDFPQVIYLERPGLKIKIVVKSRY